MESKNSKVKCACVRDLGDKVSSWSRVANMLSSLMLKYNYNQSS